jgi:hypothetical protein
MIAFEKAYCKCGHKSEDHNWDHIGLQLVDNCCHKCRCDEFRWESWG